LLIIKTYLSI